MDSQTALIAAATALVIGGIVVFALYMGGVFGGGGKGGGGGDDDGSIDAATGCGGGGCDCSLGGSPGDASSYTFDSAASCNASSGTPAGCLDEWKEWSGLKEAKYYSLASACEAASRKKRDKKDIDDAAGCGVFGCNNCGLNESKDPRDYDINPYTSKACSSGGCLSQWEVMNGDGKFKDLLFACTGNVLGSGDSDTGKSSDLGKRPRLGEVSWDTKKR